MKKYWMLYIALLVNLSLKGQIAGRNTYDFLSLPVSARAASLGGNAYAIQTNDIGLVPSNPSLMSKELHQHIAFNTGFYLAGSNYGAIIYGHYSEKLKTGFSASAVYTTYGKMDGRDPAGNPIGDFRAGDVTLNGSATGYWKKFSYGIQGKLIFSQIESYNSFGIATDIAGAYNNEKKYFTAALLVRNLGVQLNTYVDGGQRDKLPLDISIAISKRFNKLPFRLNIVAHNLQKWDLTYPVENTGTVFLNNQNKNNISFTDKLFAHFILGGEIEAGKPVRIRFGYNHLTRQSLGTGDKKGLVGFSGGFGIHIKQFSIDYGIQKIHKAGALNQIGISVNLQEFGAKTN